MTDEQIMQIASSYLRELWSGDIGDAVWQPLEEDALLKFARVIIKEHEKIREYNLGNDDYFNSWRE
jgi:hypothetical protein